MIRHWASAYLYKVELHLHSLRFRARFIVLSSGEPSVACVIGPSGSEPKKFVRAALFFNVWVFDPVVNTKKCGTVNIVPEKYQLSM